MGSSKTHLHSAKENEYAAIAKVLAHPARIAILTYVASTPGCLCKDIAHRVKLSQPTTSQHLQVIQRMKILNTKFAGSVLCYSINENTFSKMKMGLMDYLEATEEIALRKGKKT